MSLLVHFLVLYSCKGQFLSTAFRVSANGGPLFSRFFLNLGTLLHWGHPLDLLNLQHINSRQPIKGQDRHSINFNGISE